MKDPFVSILCLTYNQSSYIIDAMNGFVMQQTDFPFVAVIVDDASTDGEQNVLRNYIDEHFVHTQESGFKEWETEDAFWTIAQHDENRNCRFVVVYMKKNLYKDPDKKAEVVRDWTGYKYLALCEGDDYWTDPLKLQKQVDILEKDGSLMAVVTNSLEVDRFGNVLVAKCGVVPNNKEGRYDLRSFMYKSHYYPTATVCYRVIHREEIERMTRHTANPYLGDWTLWIVLHIFGDFYYLDDVTSAHRMNPSSLTHTSNRVGRAKASWTICKAVREILPEEYDDIRKSLEDDAWMWRDLGFAYRHERQYVRMFWAFFVAFIKNPKGVISIYKRKRVNKTKLFQKRPGSE